MAAVMLPSGPAARKPLLSSRLEGFDRWRLNSLAEYGR